MLKHDQFDKDLASLLKKKLKVDIEINAKGIQGQLKNLKAQISGGGGSGGGVRIFDVGQLEAEGRKYFVSATNIIERVKKEFKTLGAADVNVTNVFKNAKGQIQSFTADITKANGVIEKFNFSKAKLESANWKGRQSGFVFNNSILADKNFGSNLESKLSKINTWYNQLIDSQQKAFNLSNPIQDSKAIDTLKEKYTNITTAINAVKQSSDALSGAQRRNIDNMIKDANRFARLQQNKEKQALTPDNSLTSATPAVVRMNRDLTNQMASRIQSITLDFNKLRNIPPAIANEIAGLNKQFADTKGTTELESKITKYNTLNDTIKKLRAEYQSLNKQENDAMLGQRTGNSQSSFAAWLNNNSKAYKKFGDEIKELQNRFKDVKSLGELKQLNADIDSFKLKVGQAGQLGRSMFDSLKTAAAKFGSWLVASGGVMFLVQGLRQMVQTVKELDQQLVNLQMATGATRQETAKLLQTYNQMGQELGFATGEIASAANSFLRQGKTIEQTNTLVKDSLILSRVGMLDTATATQYLTSAMKGYKVSVNDVIGIIDKLSAVDLQSATDAGGLALAMQDVANIANMVGISMDRLIGYLATTGEVTQDSMDSIGTSYKTILTRMQNVKLGKFLDDEGEQISNVESILNSVGIKLRSDNQTWRNFGDVLDEVGGKWSTYSSVQKSAIANAFAGKLALCSNM